MDQVVLTEEGEQGVVQCFNPDEHKNQVVVEDNGLQNVKEEISSNKAAEIQLQNFLAIADEEENWIEKMKLVVAEKTTGWSLLQAQNSLKEFLKVCAVINDHGSQHDAIVDAGIQVRSIKSIATRRITNLCKQWSDLIDSAEKRKQTLEDSLKLFQFNAAADQIESWINSKETIVGDINYGADQDSSEALMSEHLTLMSELRHYKNIVHGLEKRFATVIKCCAISRRQEHISNQYKKLLDLAEIRQTKLIRTIYQRRKWHQLIAVANMEREIMESAVPQ